MNLSDSLPLTRSPGQIKQIKRRLEETKNRFFAEVEKRGFKVADKQEYQDNLTGLTLICPKGHHSVSTPKAFKRAKTQGCVKCSGKCPDSVRQGFYDELNRRDYKLAEGSFYQGSNTKINLVCPEGHLHFINPHNFKTGYQCPKCSGRCSEDAWEGVLMEACKRGFKIKEGAKYTNNRSKIEFICPVGHTFSMDPKSFKAGNGCNVCYGGGFNKLLPGTLYYIEFTPQPTRSVFKIGITNRSVFARYYKFKTPYRIVWQVYFDDGANALQKETEIKRKYKQYRCKDKPVYGISNIELFDVDILPTIQSFYEKC